MAFRPDIIVTNPDTQELALVVEVRADLGDLEAAEQQLRRYMFGMRSPVGMLVTNDLLRLYRDRHTEYGEASVEFVGEYEIANMLAPELAALRRGGAAARGFELENAVQAWLERLTWPSERALVPQPLRAAIEEHVLPALEQGDVRAAGPRRRTGT